MAVSTPSRGHGKKERARKRASAAAGGVSSGAISGDDLANAIWPDGEPSPPEGAAAVTVSDVRPEVPDALLDAIWEAGLELPEEQPGFLPSSGVAVTTGVSHGEPYVGERRVFKRPSNLSGDYLQEYDGKTFEVVGALPDDDRYVIAPLGADGLPLMGEKLTVSARHISER